MNLKVEATSKSMAIAPLILSSQAQTTPTDTILIILGVASTIISMSYTMFNIYLAVKEKRIKSALNYSRELKEQIERARTTYGKEKD